MKNHKTAQVPYEKYLRENPLEPKSDDNTPIFEKKLTHRDGYKMKITEDQMNEKHNVKESESVKVLEKNLNDNSGKYINHRSDAAQLSVPPINALVEQIRQKRLETDYKVDKNSNWTVSFDDKKQNGSLPKWKKNISQHDKISLENDPDRFNQSELKPKPLIGDITTADVDRIAHGIKTGASSEYDNAMMAILRLAHDERRELTDVEKKTVVSLKKSRTKNFLEKC